MLAAHKQPIHRDAGSVASRLQLCKWLLGLSFHPRALCKVVRGTQHNMSPGILRDMRGVQTQNTDPLRAFRIPFPLAWGGGFLFSTSDGQVSLASPGERSGYVCACLCGVCVCGVAGAVLCCVDCRRFMPWDWPCMLGYSLWLLVQRLGRAACGGGACLLRAVLAPPSHWSYPV